MGQVTCIQGSPCIPKGCPVVPSLWGFQGILDPFLGLCYRQVTGTQGLPNNHSVRRVSSSILVLGHGTHRGLGA